MEEGSNIYFLCTPVHSVYRTSFKWLHCVNLYSHHGFAHSNVPSMYIPYVHSICSVLSGYIVYTCTVTMGLHWVCVQLYSKLDLCTTGTRVYKFEKLTPTAKQESNLLLLAS